MAKRGSIEQLIDRVLWMPIPTLENLSAEVLRNQRTEQRYGVKAEGRLVVSGFDDEQKVAVKNVSKSGVGIDAHFALAVGSIITVIVGTTVMEGQVRWCRMNGDLFEAGILAQRVGLTQ